MAAHRWQGFYPLKIFPCVYSRSKSGSHHTSSSRNGYVRLLGGRLPVSSALHKALDWAFRCAMGDKGLAEYRYLYTACQLFLSTPKITAHLTSLSHRV